MPAPAAPVAPRTFIAGHARITAITPALIRLEYSAIDKFADQPSLAMVDRSFAPDFQPAVRRENGVFILETAELELRYREGARFSADNLTIRLKDGTTWNPGVPDTGNLRGTTRTLDGVSGAAPLSPGPLSRDGWALLDDSKSLLFGPDGWAVPRTDPDASDWYFFGYRRDYKRALRDFASLSGPVPLIPRWAFGTWWSRYWAYSDSDLKSLVAEFAANEVPLDVLVVDMDWHLPGWTGYTWDPQYFPDPAGFLRWVHSEGLRTTLNLHPHEGVQKHEAAFPAFAKAMGLDPAKASKIPFDIADRRFMRAYFELLHHPLEDQGVDFWWMDWQQGAASKISGLDPLFWLNHLHWSDMEARSEETGKRPMYFSRWAGIGGQRYQIGFSGDTYCDWASLDFQPYFTATAGNVLFPFWSHDIGGHQPGPVEPELYARWIQFGALSPILRTHATKNPLAERRIWTFPDPVFAAAREAFRLRYALVPYLYTAAHAAHAEALPMLRPLYYEWPEAEEAYAYRNQYLLGDQLLVAPVTKPGDPGSKAAHVEVWLPPGTWTHWFTGQTWEGPRTVELLVPLDQIPLFARGGAVVPMAPPAMRTRDQIGKPVTLRTFAGSGESHLYEDDGESTGYLDGERCITRFKRTDTGSTARVEIAAAEGAWRGMPAMRTWNIEFRDEYPPSLVRVNGEKIEPGITDDEFRLLARPGAARWSYDPDNLSFTVTVRDADVQWPITVDIERPGGTEELRRGLRGRATAVRKFANRLGARAPIAPVGLMQRPHDKMAWRTAADYIAWGREVLARADANAFALYKAASGEPELAREIAMQQFGVVFDVAINAAGSGGVTAVASAHRIGDASKPLSASFQFDGAAASQPAPLSAKPMQLAAAELPAGGDIPQTTQVAGTFALSGEGIAVELPFAKTLFPSINRWRVLGPFENPWEDGLGKAFPPEKQLDFSATFDGKGGARIAWREVLREPKPGDDLSAEFFVDLIKLFGEPYTMAVAYAVAEVEIDRDVEAILAFGSDDGAAVFVNGHQVSSNHRGRPYNSKEERVPVRLLKGTNTIMLKVAQGDGGWGFCAHLEDESGGPLAGAAVR